MTIFDIILVEILRYGHTNSATTILSLHVRLLATSDQRRKSKA